jgi:hypothetical protein
LELEVRRGKGRNERRRLVLRGGRPEADEGAGGKASHPGNGLRFSRGFLLGMAGVALLALVLASVTAIAAVTSGADGGRQAITPDEATPIPLEITVVPPEVTPDPDLAWSGP